MDHSARGGGADSCIRAQAGKTLGAITAAWLAAILLYEDLSWLMPACLRLIQNYILRKQTNVS